jgi:hypothetical protein
MTKILRPSYPLIVAQSLQSDSDFKCHYQGNDDYPLARHVDRFYGGTTASFHASAACDGPIINGYQGTDPIPEKKTSWDSR